MFQQLLILYRWERISTTPENKKGQSVLRRPSDAASLRSCADGAFTVPIKHLCTLTPTLTELMEELKFFFFWPHRLQHLHHPVPHKHTLPTPTSKLRTHTHILLQRRHTSPPEPPDALDILPKAGSLTPSRHRHVSHEHRDWSQISCDFMAF